MLYVLLIIMTLFGSIASLFLKKAAVSKTLIDLIKNKFLYIGGFLYLLSAILNIFILRYLDYSIVLPLTAITYIWTMIISYFILKEKITSKKIIGVFLILCGTVFIIK